jgi:hypothetical protein
MVKGRASMLRTNRLKFIMPVALLAATSIFCEEANELPERSARPATWPEVWGDLALAGIFTGERMAPNGVPFDPMFMTDVNINLGLLPEKALYFFLENEFWAQRAGAGITNPDQGKFDFSKREFDFVIGLAWNVYHWFEVRASAYALNNLNRGTSTAFPSGYQDGVQIEMRHYFDSPNIYDTGRLSFVSVGYYPTQTMIGGDGFGFHPGLSARAYGAFDIPALRSYIFGDGRMIAERQFDVRLLTLDAGIAIRPFTRLQNIELRFGDEVTLDVKADTTRNLPYGAIRINFSTR